jgi:hypothetical protein
LFAKRLSETYWQGQSFSKIIKGKNACGFNKKLKGESPFHYTIFFINATESRLRTGRQVGNKEKKNE